MWKIVLACAIMLGFASTSQQKRYIDKNGSGRNYAPDYGFIDPFEFHQQLSQNIMAQQNQQNRALSSVFATSDASAFAEASNVPDFDELFQEQFSHQQRFFDNLRRQSQAAAFGAGGSGFGSGHGYGHGYGHGNGHGTRSGSGYGQGSSSDSYSDDYAPNYASASGSYGPGGGYQSASIHPENPSLPNIHNRFSEAADSGNGGGGGYRGVSVSSYSTSSDVNGKKSNQRGATTTINDNGKITTYRVHS